MSSSAPTSLDASSQFQRDAFHAIRGEIAAVGAKDLPRITLDIRQAVMTAVGCMPELMPLKSRIVTELPLVDPELFEKMERYALALGHAHTVHLAATTPSQPIPEMTEELKGLYARLDADARALALRGIIDGEDALQLGEDRRERVGAPRSPEHRG